MIQKIIHFIWIGYAPSYVQFAIDAYKHKNPDFKLNFVHFLPNQLEDIYFKKKIKNDQHQLAYELLCNMLERNSYSTLLDRQIRFFSQFENVSFIQFFCDLFRLALLNAFGGIYVDCDTYPIKPFDDELLKNTNFRVLDYINREYEANNYFMGSNGQFISDYYGNDVQPLIQTNNLMLNKNVKKPFSFMLRRIKFFSCKLLDTDFSADEKEDVNYIEHYSDFTWGRGKVQKTKFDAMFNRTV